MYSGWSLPRFFLASDDYRLNAFARKENTATMTEEQFKTWNVVCPHCEQTFTVRFPLAGSGSPKSDDQGEVKVDCLYCEKPVIITIPRQYISEQSLLRGKQA